MGDRNTATSIVYAWQPFTRVPGRGGDGVLIEVPGHDPIACRQIDIVDFLPVFARSPVRGGGRARRRKYRPDTRRGRFTTYHVDRLQAVPYFASAYGLEVVAWVFVTSGDAPDTLNAKIDAACDHRLRLGYWP